MLLYPTLSSVSSASGLENRSALQVESLSLNLYSRASQILIYIRVTQRACENTDFPAPLETPSLCVWSCGRGCHCWDPPRGPGLPVGVVVLDTCSAVASKAWPTPQQSVTPVSLTNPWAQRAESPAGSRPDGVLAPRPVARSAHQGPDREPPQAPGHGAASVLCDIVWTKGSHRRPNLRKAGTKGRGRSVRDAVICTLGVGSRLYRVCHGAVPVGPGHRRNKVTTCRTCLGGVPSFGDRGVLGGAAGPPCGVNRHPSVGSPLSEVGLVSRASRAHHGRQNVPFGGCRRLFNERLREWKRETGWGAVAASVLCALGAPVRSPFCKWGTFGRANIL